MNYFLAYLGFYYYGGYELFSAMYLAGAAMGLDERTYNDAQKRQQYTLLSRIQKIRRHHMFQPGPSNQQFPNFNFNPQRAATPPPVLTPPPVASPVLAIQPESDVRTLSNRNNMNLFRTSNINENVRSNNEPEIRSRDSIERSHESIENDPDIQSGSKHGTQRSHAFGSSLNSAFRPSADQESRDITILSQSNQFQDQVMMKLCSDKYHYIPRATKIDLIDELLQEYESQFIQSQLTVDGFIKIFMQRYESEHRERQRREFQALKRGMQSRETYSRIIRNKKDSKSNSTLNR